PVCHVHILNRGDASAKLVFPLPEEITCVHSVDSGRLLVAGARSGRILVWAPASGRLLRSWDAHYGAVTALASGEGVLVSGGEDAAVHVWVLSQVLVHDGDVPAAPIATMSEHTMPVTSLHVSGLPLLSGRGRVYSASRDHTCKQWRVRVENSDDGKEARASGQVDLLGTLLYPAAVRDISVDLSETRVFAATAAGVFQTNLYRRTEESSNGSALVALGGTSSAVISDGHVAYPAAESDVISVSLSMDATLLVTAVPSGVVRVWDTASQQCLRTLSDKTLATGVQQLSIRMAPPQLGGPRASASAGLQRPSLGIGSLSAFDAPVRTRLADTAGDMKRFEMGLVGCSTYSETSRGDMELLAAALSPSDSSAERQIA
ncbi:Pre-rRNA-processing protein ipi3, partial [Coemansia sp. RSA 2599]